MNNHLSETISKPELSNVNNATLDVTNNPHVQQQLTRGNCEIVCPNFSLLSNEKTMHNPVSFYNIEVDTEDYAFFRLKGTLCTQDKKSGEIITMGNFLFSMQRHVITKDKHNNTINGMYDTSIIVNGISFQANNIDGSEIYRTTWIKKATQEAAYFLSDNRIGKLWEMYVSELSIKLEPTIRYIENGWVECAANTKGYVHGGGLISENINYEIKGIPSLKLDYDTSINVRDAFAHVITMLKISHNLRQTLLPLLHFITGLLYTVFTDAGVRVCYALILIGQTNSLKTTLAMLMTTIFRDSLTPVASFRDTNGGLELAIGQHSDNTLVCDDLAPSSSRNEHLKQLGRLELLLRLIGDTSGINRMTKDIKAQHKIIPNLTCIVTAETLDGSLSSMTRCLTVQYDKDSCDLNTLTMCQENMLTYKTFAFYFLYWVSVNYTTVVDFISNTFKDVRKENIGNYSYGRYVETQAVLETTASLLLLFAESVGALKSDEAGFNHKIWTDTISTVVAENNSASAEYNPAILYMQALQSMINSNKVTLLDTTKTLKSWTSNCIGFEDADNYYLKCDLTYCAVCNFWQDQRQNFGLKQKQVNSYLQSLECIHVTYENDGGKTKIVYTHKRPHRQNDNTRYLVLFKNKMNEILAQNS